MASRAGLRAFQSARFVRTPFRNQIGRRYQVTDAITAPKESLASKLWNSPVGVKTVHFWAPIMKWGIVITGISDFYRPAEKLSLTQNFALMCTGFIWTRWCLIIKPRNVLLATVNFFLGCVGVTQVGRILQYQHSIKNKPATEILKEDAKDLKDAAVGAVKEGGDKAKALAK